MRGCRLFDVSIVAILRTRSSDAPAAFQSNDFERRARVRNDEASGWKTVCEGRRLREERLWRAKLERLAGAYDSWMS